MFLKLLFSIQTAIGQITQNSAFTGTKHINMILLMIQCDILLLVVFSGISFSQYTFAINPDPDLYSIIMLLRQVSDSE